MEQPNDTCPPLNIHLSIKAKVTPEAWTTGNFRINPGLGPTTLKFISGSMFPFMQEVLLVGGGGLSVLVDQWVDASGKLNYTDLRGCFSVPVVDDHSRLRQQECEGWRERVADHLDEHWDHNNPSLINLGFHDVLKITFLYDQLRQKCTS